MAAAAEPATVSTPATTTATAACKRVSREAPSESGSHSQNNHGLA
jgi:hypothetical protein